jgi:RNA polymerase sigma-70 factor (ECF subfamily)
MSSPALSDAELVRKCQTGEWRAYNELIARHQDKLFNLICRCVGNMEDARDLCQEVFLKAFRALPEFRGDAAFGTWLHQIGVNALISWRRRRRGHAAASLNSGGNDPDADSAADPPDVSTDPAQLADQHERERFVQRAISELDEEQRILVVLRDVQGFDYQEIARMLGCPRGTVKSRLHRARLVLRDKLRPLVQQEMKK